MKKAHLHSPAASLRANLMASLVVVIIAVPLSLGIALASGMPPVSALVAAIVGGVVVGAISGAPIVVSGPAAGLSALVLSYAQQYGVEAVYKIAMIAGVVQLAFGVLRLGRFISLIPKPLLEGVLSAIGATILLGQLHILMGQKIPGGVVNNIVQLPTALATAMSRTASMWISPAFLCGLVALTVQVLWPKINRRIQWLPGALPATVIGTLIALSWNMPRVELAPLIPHMQASFVQMISLNAWSDSMQLLIPAFGLAMVASAESLLTARAIDVLVSQRHGHLKTRLEQELLAQGSGNLISGLLGGVPITGVMVRSAANFNAGANSRLSTMVHGVCIAVAVTCMPWLLETIPLAVLASVLVLTGWKLINLRSLIAAMKYHPKEAYLWPLTLAVILGTDLLKGFSFAIGVWLVVAAVKRRSPRSDAVPVPANERRA